MSVTKDTSTVSVEIPAPTPWPGVNRRLLLGSGAPMQPLQRVAGFSEDEFERFTLEWVHGYLGKKYNEVQQRGGAGDKGRDIVAWIDSSDSSPRRWDNYQCKHYKDPLTPTDIWVELGKLCYYTYRGDYTKPENLFFVTHKSIGNTLQDLLDNPTKLRDELVRVWGTYCQDKITKDKKVGPVKLEGEFAQYVHDFDFSIVKAVSPIVLIAQHRETPYHALLFGTSLKERPRPTSPPADIADEETRYVEQLYEAFSDHLKAPVKDQSGFVSHSHLKKSFDHARVCFYCAESLKEFARDALPDEVYFDDLMDQFEEGITITVQALHKDGYERMVKTTELAVTLQIGAHALREELRPNDRAGLCHQLANEDRIRWVPND